MVAKRWNIALTTAIPAVGGADGGVPDGGGGKGTARHRLPDLAPGGRRARVPDDEAVEVYETTQGVAVVRQARCLFRSGRSQAVLQPAGAMVSRSLPGIVFLAGIIFPSALFDQSEGAAPDKTAPPLSSTRS